MCHLVPDLVFVIAPRRVNQFGSNFEDKRSLSCTLILPKRLVLIGRFRDIVQDTHLQFDILVSWCTHVSTCESMKIVN